MSKSILETMNRRREDLTRNIEEHETIIAELKVRRDEVDSAIIVVRADGERSKARKERASRHRARTTPRVPKEERKKSVLDWARSREAPFTAGSAASHLRMSPSNAQRIVKILTDEGQLACRRAARGHDPALYVAASFRDQVSA